MRNLLTLFMLFVSISTLGMKGADNEDSIRRANIIESQVWRIQRLCPAPLWDGWYFKEISYDQKADMVEIIIKLPNYKEKLADGLSPANSKAFAKEITAELKGIYDYLIKIPGLDGEGDYMLYFGLGKLFYYMEKFEIGLKITLINVDYNGNVFNKIPLRLTAKEFREVEPNEQE